LLVFNLFIFLVVIKYSLIPISMTPGWLIFFTGIT
jgi:hypothetical protein